MPAVIYMHKRMLVCVKIKDLFCFLKKKIICPLSSNRQFHLVVFTSNCRCQAYLSSSERCRCPHSFRAPWAIKAAGTVACVGSGSPGARGPQPSCPLGSWDFRFSGHIVSHLQSPWWSHQHLFWWGLIPCELRTIFHGQHKTSDVLFASPTP